MPSEKLDPGIPILVAESDPWSKATLRRIFREFQFTSLTPADNVYKATHMGRFDKFKLIIIGNDLEKGSSLNVVSQIRAQGRNTKTPLIFLYGEDQEEFAMKASSEGATVTLKRPVQEPVLRETIENLMDRYILTVTMEEERNQENTSATMSSVQRGQKLLAAGDMEGAEAAFEEAMMTGAGSVEVYNGLAELYLARGDEEAAEQVLAEAERIDPQAREKFRLRDQGNIRKGQEALAKGDLDTAEEEFEHALVTGGDGTLEAFCGLVEVYIERGECVSVERVLSEAEKINSSVRDRFKDRAADLVKRGDELVNEGKMEEARAAFECAVVLDPNSVIAHAGLGEVFKSMGDDEAAAHALEKALSIEEKPDDLHVYNRMGITARKEKNFDIALRSFDRALTFDPDDPVLYYNKSMVFVAQSQFQKSLELLDRALKLDPGFVLAEQTRKKVLQLIQK